MAFDDEDYKRGAAELGADPLNLMAVSAVESSGENFWTIGDRKVPPIRPEAHWFSRLTNGIYDLDHPNISSPSWNPSIAAKTRAEAWEQYEQMKALDSSAAAESTSWGPFQIMGFHWKHMGYSNVESFVDAMDGPDDDGQMDTFVKFVKKDAILLRAIRRGDWFTWEERYNGGGYGGAYAQKIKDWLLTNANVSGEPVVPRTLVKGYKGADVKRLQRALGLVPADGEFGPITEKAVKDYQEARGLVPDGIVGRFTKESLGIA